MTGVVLFVMLAYGCYKIRKGVVGAWRFGTQNPEAVRTGLGLLRFFTRW